MPQIFTNIAYKIELFLTIKVSILLHYWSFKCDYIYFGVGKSGVNPPLPRNCKGERKLNKPLSQ
jgi:hypothetical protein